MQEEVKNYYGKVLQSSADLQTDACCTSAPPPERLQQALSRVHPEVRSRYYGCGLVAPALLQGQRILDLGSGAGQDCYVLSQLVGEKGKVVGVDMTEEQLEVARRHIDYHAEAFGYKQSNVSFHHGYIEHLRELGLADESFDIIVSNCVINLVPDKAAVLAEAWRLLRPGGELYFSDVYADRRVPAELMDDPVLYGECLSGALYWNDFMRLARGAGFIDPRLVEDRPLAISNEALKQKLGNIRFFSATFRLFKLPELESDCEDYGQAVRYLGTIEGEEHAFVLDKHHVIETGRMFPVCGNTYRMLNQSRFQPHFEFFGEWKNHYGIFAGCGGGLPFDENADTTTGSGCC
jgi:SAM-dependent methyltransferase